jgi:ABC-type sugar transport system permease subunit
MTNGTACPVLHRPDNSRRLLDFQLAGVECRRDDTGECALTANGQIAWERSGVEAAEAAAAREMTAAERLRYTRYDDAGTMSIGGGRGIRLLGRDAIFLGAVGNTLQFTFVSVILELLVGLAIVFVLEYLEAGVIRSADDITRFLDMPILGAIPSSE